MNLYETLFLAAWHYANQFYDYADLTKLPFWVFDTTQTNSLTFPKVPFWVFDTTCTNSITTPTFPKVPFWVFDNMWTSSMIKRTLTKLPFWVLDTTRTNAMTTWTLPKNPFYDYPDLTKLFKTLEVPCKKWVASATSNFGYEASRQFLEKYQI